MLLALLALLTLTALAADSDLDRVESATKVFQVIRAQHETGQASAEEVYRWSVRIYEGEKLARKAEAARNHLSRMQTLADITAGMAGQGMAPILEMDATRFYVAEAMDWAGAQAPAPTSPPGPAPVTDSDPVQAQPTSASTIEACFGQCDGVFKTCATQADHYRLGAGDLKPADPECTARAEASCGAGRSTTRVSCRETATRECQASLMQAGCAKEQTMCNARCR